MNGPDNTRNALYASLNLWDIAEEGVVLGTSGEAGSLYSFEPKLDAGFLDEGGRVSYVAAIRQALAALPPGFAASLFVDIEAGQSPHLESLRSRLEGGQGAAREILKGRTARMERTHDRKLGAHLFIGCHPADFLKLPLLPRIFFPLSGARREAERKARETLEKLSSVEGIFISQISGLAALTRLARAQAVRFYWDRLNPSKARGGAGPTEIRPFFSLRSQVALSAARDEDGFLWFDGLHHKGLSLYTFGEHLELGGAERLLSKLPQGSSTAFHFMAVDLEAALDRAKGVARRSSGLAFLQGSKNYEAQAKASELDELVTLVRASGERLLIASGCILVRDSDLSELQRKALEARMAVWECLGAESLMEDLDHRRMMLSCLPFGAAIAPRRHVLTEEACAHLGPFSGPWRGSSTLGPLFGTCEGETASLDLFEGGTPRHGVVIGSTGSGKSFTMNYLVLSLFALDPRNHFVIMDVGGSYRKLCEVLGGSYFEVSLSREYAINPFPPKEAMLDEKGEFDPDLLGYLAALIEKMAGRQASQTERAVIERALRALYVPAGEDAPLLGDFLRALRGLEGSEADRADAAGLARELGLFAEGSRGLLFNHPSRLKPFESRLTVFDLARLKEHPGLQGILIFMIGFGLAQRMARRDLRKIVVLDEGWEFFNDASASELVSRLYRTARKFNGLVISVSQSPRDFLKSQASTAMLANSFWKAFLRLDMGHEELSGFGLNPNQIEAVRSLSMKRRAYSELFMAFGDRSRVLRLGPTSLEYWIATTNAEECALEAQLRAKRAGKPRLVVLKELARREPVCA